MSSIKSLVLSLVASAPLVLASPVPNHESKNATDVTILSGPIWYSGPWYNYPAMDTWKSFDELVSIIISG